MLMGSTCFVHILLTAIHCSSGFVHTWGYHHGVLPTRWGVLYSTCEGKQQSPIDIRKRDVVYDQNLQLFNLNDLDRIDDVMAKFENNGHSVVVHLSDKRLRVTGGSLPGAYNVSQFHFHWGSANSRGSEHKINGRHSSMEMHLVTHSDKFKNVKEAMNTTNGLAVLGFFIDVGDYNDEFESIIQNIRNIQHKNDSVIIKALSLSDLFPQTTYYYRYFGSLTTPPCYESVIWTVFVNHIFISQYQLDQFHSLGKTHFKGSEDLINNYRNPQPLNGRKVTTNLRLLYGEN